jgi:hypothetical protein
VFLPSLLYIFGPDTDFGNVCCQKKAKKEEKSEKIDEENRELES